LISTERWSVAYCQNCGTSVDEADVFCVSCGTALEAAGEPERDESVRLGTYSLVGEIGRGATGIVYLATDSQSGRQVALKVLDPILSGIPGYPERLRSESAVLSHLSDPHLVATYGMDEDQGHLFLVTEYVEGASLRAVEQNAGQLTPEQSLGIMAGVLEGLGLVHAHGLVHGDVKPENILVDRTGTSKLVDFGQVVSTGSTTLGGTPSYMSPESVRGQAADARSDLYSMGVVLYEALAGNRPFVAANDLATLRMHAEADPPPVEGLGTHTSALLGWALAKNPDGRPQSAGVFLAELEAAAAADYGEDWKKRAAVAVVAAAVTTGVVELAAPAPAGAATAAISPAPIGAAPTGATAPSATSGGLLASHPVASVAAAVLLVGAVVAGGLTLAHRGGTTPTPSTVAVSARPVTFATVEQTACAAIGAHDSEGDRCAMLSMHVSTVSPQWVLVQGLGFYTGTDQPPSEQEARSDLDDAILNLRTHRVIGPTNVGFCQVPGANVSGPELSGVPTAVVAGWGLHGCTGGTSTSTTAAVPPATTAVPPPATPASTFTAWSGSWGAHEQELSISATGVGHMTYADLTACPSCSFGSAPAGTVDFTLTSVNGSAASGMVSASSDPKNYTVGAPVTVSLTAGSPGQILDVSVGGAGAGDFCNSTSAGQCGA